MNISKRLAIIISFILCGAALVETQDRLTSSNISTELTDDVSEENQTKKSDEFGLAEIPPENESNEDKSNGDENFTADGTDKDERSENESQSLKEDQGNNL